MCAATNTTLSITSFRQVELAPLFRRHGNDFGNTMRARLATLSTYLVCRVWGMCVRVVVVTVAVVEKEGKESGRDLSSPNIISIISPISPSLPSPKLISSLIPSPPQPESTGKMLRYMIESGRPLTVVFRARD